MRYMGNQCSGARPWLRAFVSFDTMLAALPIIIMMVYTVKMTAIIWESGNMQLETQEKFDKLVSAANYLVNYGLVKKDGDKYYPNWVIGVDGTVVEKVKEAGGFDYLHVGFEKGSGTCIYRLIVYGEKKEIRQLFVCGEQDNAAIG